MEVRSSVAPDQQDSLDRVEVHYKRIERLVIEQFEKHQKLLEDKLATLMQQRAPVPTSVPVDAQVVKHSVVKNNPYATGVGQADMPIPTNENYISDGSAKVSVSAKNRDTQFIESAKVDQKWERMQQIKDKDECLLDTVKDTVPIDGIIEQSKTKRLNITKLQELVESTVFNVTMSMCIIANSIFIAIHADYVMRSGARHYHRKQDPDFNPDWAQPVEIVFASVFTIELLIRIFAWECEFFFGEDWRWNLLDLFLVVASCIDMILTYTGLRMTFVRMMRLLRVSRGLRVVRMLRFFRPFRIMLLGFMGSMVPLLWACLFLVSLTYVFSVTISQGVSAFVEEHLVSNSPTNGNSDPDGPMKNLMLYFDSLPMAMLSLYMAITSGVSWIELVFTLQDVSGFCLFLLIVYVTLMVLVALNIVTATFVNDAAEVAQHNRELAAQTEQRKKAALVKELEDLFKKLDNNVDGFITKDEFKNLTEDAELRHVFATFKIDVTDAEEVFELLDVDGSSTVEVDEFVIGCMDLAGGASAVNMESLLRENKQLIKKVEKSATQMRNEVKCDLAKFDAYLRAMCGQADVSMHSGEREETKSASEVDTPQIINNVYIASPDGQMLSQQSRKIANKGRRKVKSEAVGGPKAALVASATPVSGES